MSLNNSDSDYGNEKQDDYDDDDYAGRHSYCWLCGGARFILTCPDDMCRGAGECMHGDGESNCPECNRDGKLEWEI